MLNAGISSTQNIVHTGGSNYLLADGHVKWFQGQKVSSGGNSGSSSTANTGGADGTGTLGGTTESSTSPVAVATFSYT
jgi:prepilin-type processing-associated H-X9-DG protein